MPLWEEGPWPVETSEDQEIEILLLSTLGLCEQSDPDVEIDLALLTPVEKRLLLVLLYQNLGFVSEIARRWRGGGSGELFSREICHAA